MKLPPRSNYKVTLTKSGADSKLVIARQWHISHSGTLVFEDYNHPDYPYRVCAFGAGTWLFVETVEVQ